MTRSMLFVRGVVLLGMVQAVACIRTAQLGDDGDTEGSGEVDPSVTLRCERFIECGCEQYPFVAFSTQSECEDLLQTSRDDMLAFADQHALTHNPECEQLASEYYSRPGCEPPDPQSYLAQQAMESCSIYYGSGQLGDPCEDTSILGGGASTCADGLVCEFVDFDTGARACAMRRTEGQECVGNSALAGECTVGLTCEAHDGGSSSCIAPAQLGEPCTDGGCNLDGECVGEICVVKRGPGEPCDRWSDCAWGYCDDDTLTCFQKPAACGGFTYSTATACEREQVEVFGFQHGNAECEVDQDCVAIDAPCAYDSCSRISVSVDYDQAAWAEVIGRVEDRCADSECSDTACGTPICREGQCTMLL